MFTTIAWSESVDLNGVLSPIAACTDQHMKTVGDSVYINQYNKLLGGMAFTGASGVRARFVSPSLRRFQPHEITPINLGLIPGATFMHDVDNYKVKNLDIDEQLNVEMEANPGAAEQISAVAWLSDTEVKEVYGDITSVRFTITLALVAGAWAFSAITFVDELATGAYDIVGMNLIAANGIAARLVPVGASNRPGVPVMQTAAGQDPMKTFRHGRMGVMCSFLHNTPPSVEVLASAAAVSATYAGILDIIKKA